MRVLTVTHGENVGPELFAEVATADGHELVEWDMQQAGPPPRGVDAVAVFGGHQNVGEEDKYPWLVDEYSALRHWVGAGVPLFAVCLGAQTLAHALDAPVARLDKQLGGFYRTELTDDGAADPVLGALPREFECFNGNAYAFELPEGASLLATGPCLQAFRVGERAWGVQFHPELERPTFLGWFDDERAAALAPEVEAKLPAWRPLGTALFRAFLREAARARRWPAPLTIREVAAELACSEDDVRTLIDLGELRTVACGVRPGLVPRHQLDAYLRRLQHRLGSSNAASSGSARSSSSA